MRPFWIFITTLIIAATSGVLMHQDPGYALFAYKGWTTEMPLWLAIVLIAGLFITLYALLRTLHTVRSTSKAMSNWYKNHQQRSARLQISKGLLALAEGRWKQAERYLSHSVGHSDHPLVNYVYAAFAAQALKADDRRDQYLALAEKHGLKDTVGIRLTQAVLQIKAGHIEESTESLKKLHQEEPNHVEVLRLLSETYQKKGDFPSLFELLPTLKKKAVFDKETFESLEYQTYESLLPSYATQGLNALKHFWQEIPNALQKNANMLHSYANCLMQNEAYSEAEAILVRLLDREG